MLGRKSIPWFTHTHSHIYWSAVMYCSTDQKSQVEKERITKELKNIQTIVVFTALKLNAKCEE